MEENSPNEEGRGGGRRRVQKGEGGEEGEGKEGGGDGAEGEEEVKMEGNATTFPPPFDSPLSPSSPLPPEPPAGARVPADSITSLGLTALENLRDLNSLSKYSPLASPFLAASRVVVGRGTLNVPACRRSKRGRLVRRAWKR